MVSSTSSATPSTPSRSDMRATYQLKPLSILTVLMEIGFILGCAFFFSRHLMDTSPNVMFGGPDYPSAMHENSFIYEIFQKTGRIPLWDPFIGFGQPMLENLASSAVNPLVMLPIMFFGPVQGGKIALFFHIFLMAIGGWLLGRVLRLNWPGRVLLGLLVCGSGSIITQFGIGFTHLGFPQVYIPFALTGLIGTLYLRKRWPIVMLAVASTLMPFSGGEWYVLPTAIAAAFLSLFAIVAVELRPVRIALDGRMIKRLLLATAFTVGLVAIRVFTFNRPLVYHPSNWGSPPADLLQVIYSYFAPFTPHPESGDLWISYHYVMPLAFIIMLLIGRLLIYRPADENRGGMWRIVIPALIVIAVLTVWAEGLTPFLSWLYDTIPFLSDWKNSGRIAAGATPWLIVLAALWFDDIADSLMRAMAGVRLTIEPHGLLAPILRLKRAFQPNSAVARATLIFVAILGLYGAFGALSNWQHLVDTRFANLFAPGEQVGVGYIRAQYPSQFLSVLTEGWITHFSFVNNLARTTHGDATIFTFGIPSTIGPDSTMRFQPQFSVGTHPSYVGWMKDNGYVPLSGATIFEGQPIAWYNAAAPGYAFTVLRSALENRDWHPLTAAETHPVTYFNQIDSIVAVVDNAEPGSLLVIDETNYPGWNVTIDGEHADLQSVGSRLAVILPDHLSGSPPLHIVFDYHPLSLYLAGYLTILTAVLCIGFLLRIDERVSVRIPESVRGRAEVVAKRAVYVLTTPGILDGDAPPPALTQPERLLMPPSPNGANEDADQVAESHDVC